MKGWLQVLQQVPMGLENQIVLQRASWLGVAQWLRGHLQHRVCHSVTVCWSAAPVVRREFILCWFLCLKGFYGCQIRSFCHSLSPVLCFWSRSWFCLLQLVPVPPGKACKLGDSQRRSSNACVLSCTSDSESLDGRTSIQCKNAFQSVKV